MDAIVEAALRKWPNVPFCHGWLGLDARGDWYLRDQRAQAAGPFAPPRQPAAPLLTIQSAPPPLSKGSLIQHVGLREFIGRNYACDAAGCWYFQNGPQRVYVELELAPWVWRLAARGDSVEIESHTGRGAAFESGWVDEHGHLFVATGLGLGVVHSLDMHVAAAAIESSAWPVIEVPLAALPRRFGYVLSPASASGKPAG